MDGVCDATQHVGRVCCSARCAEGLVVTGVDQGGGAVAATLALVLIEALVVVGWPASRSPLQDGDVRCQACRLAMCGSEAALMHDHCAGREKLPVDEIAQLWQLPDGCWLQLPLILLADARP